MAKKLLTMFVCQECGYESPQWLGKCPECQAWNTFKEFKIDRLATASSPASVIVARDMTPKMLSEIGESYNTRLKTTFSEMDSVLGGGIVNGSVTLIAGDPGIGKSTLLLQTCIAIAQSGTKVLYISGEESIEQIKMRAARIADIATLKNLLLLSTSSTDAIADVVESVKPSLVIIDSIQTMESQAAGGMSGSVSQIRYTSTICIRIAKTKNIPFILVGHVTKEGMVAGPMVLSHMVDTVLFLEGEKFTTTRILRSLKNRFGPVDEVGVFQMEEKGMIEIKNPEQIFMTDKKEDSPGSVLVVIMEGTRPFLIEIQALVVYSKFPMPRRVASGVDSKRLELLLAVLQKHCKLPLESVDVYVNIAGGLRVDDPAADLGICLAVYSSLKNKTLSHVVCMAEVGLQGELRMVLGLDKRVRQAKKLGFTKIITATTQRSLMAVLGSLE